METDRPNRVARVLLRPVAALLWPVWWAVLFVAGLCGLGRR